MSDEEQKANQPTSRQDRFENWATPNKGMRATKVPDGATNINVEGRQVTSPFQGFGSLWQKTYSVVLDGIKLTPEEVMQHWKQNFQKFQPSMNQFHFSSGGANPGEVIYIDSTLPAIPGTPGIIPLSTGVMVMYEDETSFTVITPEGHPEAGWNTFSTEWEDGKVVARIKGIARAADPIYEFGNRFMGGAQMQENTWMHVLEELARDTGAKGSPIMMKECLDPSVQWSQAKNVWKNAAIRTFFYKLATPVRWVLHKLGGKINP